MSVHDVVPRFGPNPTELCLIFNSVLDFLYWTHQHRLQNWNMNPFLQPERLHTYAETIHQHGAPLQNCLGFVDGIVLSIAIVQGTQKGPWDQIPKCCDTKWLDSQSLWTIRRKEA